MAQFVAKGSAVSRQPTADHCSLEASSLWMGRRPEGELALCRACWGSFFTSLGDSQQALTAVLYPGVFQPLISELARHVAQVFLRTGGIAFLVGTEAWHTSMGCEVSVTLDPSLLIPRW